MEEEAPAGAGECGPVGFVAEDLAGGYEYEGIFLKVVGGYWFSSCAFRSFPVTHPLEAFQRSSAILRLICISARCPFTVIRNPMGASPFFNNLVLLIKKRIEK